MDISVNWLRALAPSIEGSADELAVALNEMSAKRKQAEDAVLRARDLDADEAARLRGSLIAVVMPEIADLDRWETLSGENREFGELHVAGGAKRDRPDGPSVCLTGVDGAVQRPVEVPGNEVRGRVVGVAELGCGVFPLRIHAGVAEARPGVSAQRHDIGAPQILSDLLEESTATPASSATAVTEHSADDLGIEILDLRFNPGGLLEAAIDKLGLSARAFNRVLKIARTVADLEAGPNILVDHISEAIQYRSLDRGSQFR